jgi:micrococcal nuclease
MNAWLLVAASLTALPGGNDFEGMVSKVVDGGTVLVRPRDGQEVVVRLIGLEAPRKASRDTTGQEPWGTRAQQALALKVARKVVRIEYDVVRPASLEGNSAWGYLWLGDRLLNEEVLREGQAVIDTRPPNVKYVERLQTAASEARAKGRGVWNPAEPLPEPPGQFVARKQKTEEARAIIQSELSLVRFEEGCVIANSQTKKYHVPTGRYYKQARESKNAVYFRTAEDAEKAGYTASAR